jgi:hypothetical protein
MKKALLITLMVLAVAGFALAQIQTPTSDVLGAHLNYGRGCAGCHAPHSGAYGNGAAGHVDTSSGNMALWGQDTAGLYGKQIITGGTIPSPYGPANFPETLPSSMNATTPDVWGLLTCLSCHDGNYAQGAMMRNQVYETLPSTYGTKNTIPTLLGNDGTTTGNYLNDHPVGLAAAIGCGGTYNWDCTISNGTILMNGPFSSKFVQDYGYFVSPANYSGTPVVMCTTCHNQHVMNVVRVNSANSGQPAGNYATMFFLIGPYNPASTTAGSNQTAQFCRQCHGYGANETFGANLPTVF